MEILPQSIRSPPVGETLGGGGGVVVGAEDVIGAEIEGSGARDRSAGGSTGSHGRKDQELELGFLDFSSLLALLQR